MYHGPGLFVDKPAELFHSRAWTSSARASDGIYPHLPHSNGLLLPGDFIYYRCINLTCFCYAILDDGADTDSLHIGRITAFGYDLRTSSCTAQSWEILALQIQPALRME